MKFLRNIFHFDNIIATIIVFFIVEHFSIYQNLDFLNPFINTVQDLTLTDVVFSKIRSDGRYGTDSNIVLVNVGFLSRAGIAKEIEIINKYEPKVIGIDIFFRILKDETQDLELAFALSNVENLVMMEKLRYDYDRTKFDSISRSHPAFTRNAKFGFANIIVDLKGKSYKDMTAEEKEEKNRKYIKTVRQITIKEEIKGQKELFFAAKIAEIYAPEKFKRLIARNTTREIVNFRRNIDQYITLDIKDIFEGSEKLKLIKGRIVLFGLLGADINTAVSEDAFVTPMNPQYVGKTFPDMYGVLIHANVLSMILDESYFTVLPDWVSTSLIWVILYTMMVGLFLLRHKSKITYEPLSLAMVFLSLVVWYIFIIYLFHIWNLYLELEELFLVILLTVPVFEAYQDSLKPLLIKNVAKIVNFITQSKHRETKADE